MEKVPSQSKAIVISRTFFFFSMSDKLYDSETVKYDRYFYWWFEFNSLLVYKLKKGYSWSKEESPIITYISHYRRKRMEQIPYLPVLFCYFWTLCFHRFLLSLKLNPDHPNF